MTKSTVITAAFISALATGSFASSVFAAGNATAQAEASANNTHDSEDMEEVEIEEEVVEKN